MWCVPAKAFSGPVVEFFLYFVNLFVGDVAEVGSFGEILADEAVGVFIEPSFPGMVGMGKVACGL